jgi:hypothetical protein
MSIIVTKTLQDQMGSPIAEHAGSMFRTLGRASTVARKTSKCGNSPCPSSTDRAVPRRLAAEASGISEARLGQQAKFLIDDRSPMSARHGVGGITTFPSTRTSRLHQSRVRTNAFP